MRKVKLTRTVSFEGKMYLRGQEVVLDKEALIALSSYYEPVDKPKKADIPNPKRKPKASAILKPVKTTVMKSPEPRKKKSISTLNLSGRIESALNEAGIETVEELKKQQDLTKIKGIGAKSAKDITKAIE